MRASLERESDVFPIAPMEKNVSLIEAGREIRSVSEEVAPRSFEDGCAQGVTIAEVVMKSPQRHGADPPTRAFPVVRAVPIGLREDRIGREGRRPVVGGERPAGPWDGGDGRVWPQAGRQPSQPA